MTDPDVQIVQLSDPGVTTVTSGEFVIEQDEVKMTVISDVQTADSSDVVITIDTVPRVLEIVEGAIDPAMYLLRGEMDRPGGVLSFDRAELVISGIIGELQLYVHTQPVASTTWVVEHNLGYDPVTLMVRDTDDAIIEGFGVQYITPGQTLHITHDTAVAGTARVR